MDEPQRQLILGTAGHIDHGKTALVRALTGIDTDRLPQEKRRGITIDIGFAALGLGEYELGIVDVPGHERFVRNMLAGASGNNLAMLVVAADDSVMPQTREHLEILKLLDVQHGVIAVTKCDLAEPAFIELVDDEVRELVAGSFLERAAIVHTSATNGQGLDELKEALRAACELVAQRPDGELFRMAVDRSFVMQGQGTVVTGTVAAGRLGRDDEVQWQPSGQSVRIRSLESHGRKIESVRRGQRAAIGLVGVHHRQIVRGHELATPGYLKPSRTRSVRLNVSAASPWPVKHRQRVRLHLGTGHTVATVLLPDDRVVPGGGSAAGQMLLAEPMTATCGQAFVVRSLSPAHTLGGGHVLQPLARRYMRRDAQRFQRVVRLESGDAAERAAAVLWTYETSQWSEPDLCRDANVTREQVGDLVRELGAAGTLVELAVGPQRVLRVHADVLRDLLDRIVSAVLAYHLQHPLHAAVPRPTIGEHVGLTDEMLLGVLLDRLESEGRLVIHGTAGAASADFSPTLSATEQAIYDQLVGAHQQARFEPPARAALTTQCGADEPTMRQLFDLAVAQGELCHLGGGLYLHAAAEAKLRDTIQGALQQRGGLTVSDIRQLLGTSRKFAVPICEYLDRVGVTRRQGDVRVAPATPATPGTGGGTPGTGATGATPATEASRRSHVADEL